MMMRKRSFVERAGIERPIPSVREAVNDLAYALMNEHVTQMPEIVIRNRDDWFTLRRILNVYEMPGNSGIQINGIVLRRPTAPAKHEPTEWDFCA